MNTPNAIPPRSILIVEDNPLFAQALARVIKRLSPADTVCVCSTVQMAVDYLNQTAVEPDLVLVDLNLPDRPGVVVIGYAHQRFPQVPIMVISVISSEEQVLQSIRAGAQGYILKGDSEAAISQSIEEVLAGNYPISPSLARTLFMLAGGPPKTARYDLSPEIELSPREIEVLRNIAQGFSYTETAERMHVALSTVQTHIRKMYRKLGAKSQTQAILKAREVNLL